jgi:hypothetical protein
MIYTAASHFGQLRILTVMELPISALSFPLVTQLFSITSIFHSSHGIERDNALDKNQVLLFLTLIPTAPKVH